MTAPDLTTEVVGYRQWRVTPHLELRAAAHRDRPTWGVGVNEARCHRIAPVVAVSFGDVTEPVESLPCEDTPGSDCECGFYALHDPNDLWYGRQTQQSNLWAGLMVSAQVEEDPLVSGIIVAWGKVEVHHQGFRAQFARIAALAVPDNKRDAVVARAAAAAYGVSCVLVDELPKVAAEFGATVPIDMRPEKPEPKELELGTWQWQPGNQIVGNSFYYSTYRSPPPLSPPPKPRPPSRFERKRSNRQGPGGYRKRPPKNIDPGKGLA